MSRRFRFFAPGAGGKAEIRLDAAESHYLLRVLRLAPGADCEVFDGEGAAFAVRFVGTDDEQGCRLERGSALSPREPAVRLEAGVALPKGDGFTPIVRQLAEIGAASITPLVTEHSEGTATGARLPRWRAAALSGARQCGRALIPAVAPPLPFADWVRGDLPDHRFLAARGGAGSAPPRAEGRALAVGPEGGLSPEEIAAAREYGFEPLGLGERTLRTGTAALVAAARLIGP